MVLPGIRRNRLAHAARSGLRRLRSAMRRLGSRNAARSGRGDHASHGELTPRNCIGPTIQAGKVVRQRTCPPRMVFLASSYMLLFLCRPHGVQCVTDRASSEAGLTLRHVPLRVFRLTVQAWWRSPLEGSLTAKWTSEMVAWMLLAL